MLAALFCIYNGGLQGRQWTSLEVRTFDGDADAAIFCLGVAVWAAGLYINLHSDHILRNLRRPGETAYKVRNNNVWEGRGRAPALKRLLPLLAGPPRRRF